MAKKHVFWVKGLYEKRSLEEQGDLSLKVMGKKVWKLFLEIRCFVFSSPLPPLLFEPPQWLIFKIFSNPPPVHLHLNSVLQSIHLKKLKIQKLTIFHTMLFFRFVIAGEYIFINMNSSCWGIIFPNVFTKVDILKIWQLNICHGVFSTAVAKIY